MEQFARGADRHADRVLGAGRDAGPGRGWRRSSPSRARRPTAASNVGLRPCPLRFHLPGDPVHRAHRLERVLAHGRLRAQHHRVGAVQDGVGHIGRFGPRRHRRMDHRLQHLGGRDDRLPVQIGFPDDPLLHQRDFLEGQLDAEVAARHHDRVGSLQDAAQVAEGGVLLDLGHQLDVPRNQPPKPVHIGCLPNERQRDEIDPERQRLYDVFPILVGQGRCADVDARQVHALV